METGAKDILYKVDK